MIELMCKYFFYTIMLNTAGEFLTKTLQLSATSVFAVKFKIKVINTVFLENIFHEISRQRSAIYSISSFYI